MEIMVSIVLTTLLVGMMASVIMASLDTIGVSTRSVEQSDGAAHLMAELHRDVRGMCEFQGDEAGVFYLSNNGEETVLAIARLEPVSDALDAQGYVRHVVYRWDQKAGTLTRAAYHSARDRKRILETGSESGSGKDSADLARLAELTPAYAAKEYEWLQAPEIKEAMERAEETPLIDHVLDWKVDCFETPGSVTGKAVTEWTDPDKVPFAMRVSLRMRVAGGDKKFREFQLWIPIQTVVAGGAS